MITDPWLLSGQSYTFLHLPQWWIGTWSSDERWIGAFLNSMIWLISVNIFSLSQDNLLFWVVNFVILDIWKLILSVDFSCWFYTSFRNITKREGFFDDRLIFLLVKNTFTQLSLALNHLTTFYWGFIHFRNLSFGLVRLWISIARICDKSLKFLNGCSLVVRGLILGFQIFRAIDFWRHWMIMFDKFTV